MGKVIRQGQGVVGMLGIDAQAGGDVTPVQPGTDNQTNGDPAFGESFQVDRARQTHQQPATHVGGPGRERGDEAAKAAATENIVCQIARREIAEPADQQHAEQVEGKGQGDRIVPEHDLLLQRKRCRSGLLRPMGPSTKTPTQATGGWATGKRPVWSVRNTVKGETGEACR